MNANLFKLGVVLFLILGISLGCAPPPSTPPEKVVINAMSMVYGDPGDPLNYEGQSWKKIVDDFEKANPDIDIQYEMWSNTDYDQRVAYRLAHDDIPDLALIGGGSIWKDAGQQFDHIAYIDPNYYDMTLIPPMGQKCEIWEIPYGTMNICSVLYMNKPLLESLGLSDPTSYTDIVDMVKTAHDAGKEVITIDGADGWPWSSCLLSCIIARLSGDPHWVSKAVAGTNKFTDPVFVAALMQVSQMVADGVISQACHDRGDDSNLDTYNNGNALFMIQGQWLCGGISKAGSNPLSDHTLMRAFPAFPGEQSNMAGSVAAAITTGYGLTKKGGTKPAVRDATLKFLEAFYHVSNTNDRLINTGLVVMPILKNYIVPTDLPSIVYQKLLLGMATISKCTDVIDAFLSGAPNDTLNSGIQAIVAGTKTPAEVAREVEDLRPFPPAVFPCGTLE